jgi:hypothetical protein
MLYDSLKSKAELNDACRKLQICYNELLGGIQHQEFKHGIIFRKFTDFHNITYIYDIMLHKFVNFVILRTFTVKIFCILTIS